MPPTVAMAGLATGASPTTAFPCDHLNLPPRTPSWSRSVSSSPLEELMQAVSEEDWARNFEEGLTTICMRSDWSAKPERCDFLKVVAASSQAKRVLEIGSFCGVAALALADALPEGQVHAIEIDPFVVKLGERFRNKSMCGRQITTHVGPAMEKLQTLAQEVRAGKLEPFDFVVVDADKAGMRGYFDVLWDSGLLSERAVVCVDLTPFKGQPPLRYVKYGFPYTWEAESGRKEIDDLKAHVAAAQRFASHEAGQLLVVQRAR